MRHLDKKRKLISTKNGISIPFLVLIFMLLTAYSCKEKVIKTNNNNASTDRVKNIKKSILTDSITINILMPANQFLILNIKNRYLQNYALHIKNPSSKDSIITKTIVREHLKQVIRFGLVVMDNGVIQYYHEHFYLIDEKLNNLNFEFKKNKDLELLNEDKSIIIDGLHKKYDSLKLFLNRKKKKDTLYKVFNFFKEKYKIEDKKLLAELNRSFYMSLLQKKEDKEIEDYLENIKNPIVSNALYNVFYTYSKNNVLKFNYSDLNANNKSKEFLKYLSISIFNFIRHEDNKGNKKYYAAISWLKTTDFYKKDSIFIKKEILPLSKTKFKKKIKQLNLLTPNDSETSILNIIKKHPSNYYLIDFWATWCAPCIEGVNTMREMDFPQNVKIISISLDKEKDKQKWKLKTKELAQSYSYWLDEKSNNAKLFLEFIELQSIPRYILIDKNMNLIDQAFLHPNEPQFLTKLKDVRNSKYW